MGYTIKTEKDIDKKLSGLTKLIVKKIKAVTTKEEPEPGREFEVFLIEPNLPEDFEAFVQRMVMLINEMGASEVLYKPEKHSIIFMYD